MTLYLPDDCLNDIFEYLKKRDLRSCLLVSRLWCNVSVRILWRKMQNFKTLITCLPKKSKAILCKIGIIISTSRPSLFNYTSFIKILCINDLHRAIIRFLRNHPSTPKRIFCIMITREMFKMFMNQTSLKILYFEFNVNYNIPNIPFTTYPGGKDCLSNLSEISCSSNLYPEFFYQISRICHNLQSLKITFEYNISNGLSELISVQKYLNYLELDYKDYHSVESEEYYSFSDVSDKSDLDYCRNHLDESQPLAKIPNTLTKLHIDGRPCHMQLSFISKLSNLQELSLSIISKKGLKEFKNLQHVIFPQLQIVTFEYRCPKVRYLINFLEINGKNFKILDLGKNDSYNNSLNLAIANFCTNLKSLRFTYTNTNLNYYLDLLKVIFKGCEQLESLDFLCGDCEDYILEREFLEMVVEFSPKKFHELKLEMGSYVDADTAFQWGFKTIFKRWANRVPCIPLSLTIITKIESEIILDKRNEKLIKKYKKLGVIKEIKIFNEYHNRGCH
ncbi:8730_t:CDS:1 [Funneliformis mosseae]|uniref:8730_t:CDS:1 n=1 Tax=Funneliformis mosseae TaxID=27381 RepID=A0A9N8WMD4_FUNMO|nr:8730_t:CDS:1 [Funneliformis mosseae]